MREAWEGGGGGRWEKAYRGPEGKKAHLSLLHVLILS